MPGWLQEFQARNRAIRQEKIDDAVFEAIGDCIRKATSAMMEAQVEKGKIKDLLIKHWNLRPSEADFFIQESENQ